ncbi:fumarylacetoacetate hydrolase family protein [Parasphingopyxis algicola]|nr:fumarylacetoacetate hydrolase family protein [Parasphingopyxis algicola]
MLWPAPAPVLLPVDSIEEMFPVRRVYCVGRNYAAHAREMGSDEREPPFFFTKFADTAVPSGGSVLYPPRTKNFHFEGELVIAIAERAGAVSVEDALDSVYGYAAGLDMTRRDLQLEARDKGRPWDTGKNFSEAAIVGPICPKAPFGEQFDGKGLRLSVNGQVRQQTALGLMIWSCAEIIAELSTYDELHPGDLIFTGTPEGVGAVERGDSIELVIDGLPRCEIEVAK